ncbi:MAG: hypothetical protein P4L51_11100 [Puia sp.]|nr:hypothetical protein [Puia sp.]
MKNKLLVLGLPIRKEDFLKLIDKYLDGTAGPDERLLIEEYYNRLAAMEPLSQDGHSSPPAPVVPEI